MIGADKSMLSWALNWGIAYNLPNETIFHRSERDIIPDMPKMIYQRKNRQELFHKLELVIDK